jgi:hypothetical protein
MKFPGYTKQQNNLKIYISKAYERIPLFPRWDSFHAPIIFFASFRGKPEVFHTDISMGNTEDAN